MPAISVVINTYNRARSLAVTLDALRLQRFTDFEVVVVDGPSDDGTKDLLDTRAADVRAVHLDARNLSVSRNLGIDAAAGEVVAFIDDDAVPEARWLEDLARAYSDPAVAGAGGLVLDNTGVRAQYRYSLCDRMGRTDFDRRPPFDAEQRPGADPFVYLQGTNCSFRRGVLEEIEGFDEEIEYNYDEAEVCARVIDAGHRLAPLPDAVVHHKFLPSHMRSEQGFTDPFLAIKNRVYFALRMSGGFHPRGEVLASLHEYLGHVKDDVRNAVRRGLFTTEEADRFEARADAGFALGRERGEAGVRKGRVLAPRDPEAFRPYPVRVPDGRRVSVCFASLDYPPQPIGGVGRYTHDLARALAAQGHEAHVVTRDDTQPYRIDFEDDVWVHRFPIADRWIPELDGKPVKLLLDHHAAVRGAVERAAARVPFDVVTGSSWIGEPLLCALDGRRPVNVVCVTPMRTIAAAQPATAAEPLTDHQIAVEDALLRAPVALQPISREVARLAGADEADVVPLGTEDRRRDRARSDDAVEILFVGRLEPRKGIDTLLAAGAEVLRAHPQARLRIAGADNPHANGAPGAWPAWVAEHAADVAQRIRFDGLLDDEALMQAYADCDVFCGPSRYESFGLVHVEAMMMGRPVVGCDVGGMRETVVDGETGRLVAPGDADGLRDALAELVADARLRERMGAAGRARYEAQYTIAVAAERHLERFRTLTPPPRGDLPALLEELCGLERPEAESAARALLDLDRFPQDVHGGVLRALEAPDAVGVVDGLFRALLGRTAIPEGLGYVSRVEAGADMRALVHEIAGGVEGRARDYDRAFLADVPRQATVQLRHALRAAWLHDDDAAFAADLAVLMPEAPSFTGGNRAAYVRTLFGDRVDGVELATESEILREILAARGDEVLEVIYRRVLGREPDAGAAAYRGRDAATILRVVGTSDEAAGKGFPPAVAERLAQRASRRFARLRANQPAAPGPALAPVERELKLLQQQFGVLLTKHEALARTVREKLPDTAPAQAPEPEIPDREALQRRIEQIGGLRLNLGCGEKPLDGYVNVDFRQLPRVDVIADVHRLPFEPGTVDEIASFHLLEHFREHHAETVLLPYWHSLLRPGGVLRTVTPNYEAMVAQLNEGRLSFADFKHVTFGGQDYEGDDHFALYSPATLERLLEAAGFRNLQIVVADRQNGLSPEMEVTARR